MAGNNEALNYYKYTHIMKDIEFGGASGGGANSCWSH